MECGANWVTHLTEMDWPKGFGVGAGPRPGPSWFCPACAAGGVDPLGNSTWNGLSQTAWQSYEHLMQKAGKGRLS